MDQQAPSRQPLTLVTMAARPKTDVDEVLEDVRRSSANIADIVVLYRTKNGETFAVSNQGDIAGAILAVEKAKIALLKDDIVQRGPAVG